MAGPIWTILGHGGGDEMRESTNQLELVKGGWAEEILAAQLPETHHIVQGLLPTGLTVLAGPPKAAKTVLSFQAALSIAQGLPLFGCLPTRQGGSLYLAFEEMYDLTQIRLKIMGAENQLPPRTICIMYDWPTISKGGVVNIGNYLHLNRNTRLVVIDVLQRFKGDHKKGSYGHDYSELTALQKLANQMGTCILLLHHTTKKIPSNWQAGLYGTQGLAGVADTSLLLDRPNMDEVGRLCVTGRKCHTREFNMRFNQQDLNWTLLGEAHGKAGSPERSAILECLAEAHGPLSPRQVASETGLGNRSIFNMLTKITANGLAIKAHRGRYMITEKGVAATKNY